MNEKLDKNTVERSLHDYMYKYLPRSIENYVTKFHQSANFTLAKNNRHTNISSEILYWATTVENTDSLPAYYDNIVQLESVNRTNKNGSQRLLDTEKKLSLKQLSIILYEAFGRGENQTSKRYGSAGSLYPVIPLLIIFEEYSSISTGVYAYDEKKNCLLKIKSWSLDEAQFVKNEVCMFAENLSNICIAYAIDIKKSIFKYRFRGYRHALIEIGAMTQCFKESLYEADPNLCQVSWSGFNDNQLTHWCGLNVKLCPITLLQWFGYKRSV